MFRRTKLIALLVALALVCLIAVQLALIWSPDNPLRFHIIAPTSEKLEKSVHDGAEYVSGYQVQVENTSGATIHILRAELFGPDGSEGDRIYISTMEFVYTGSGPDSSIPSHGSRRFDLSMFKASYVSNLERSDMRYSSISRLKENYMDVLDYLERKWLPPSFTMRFYPDLDGDDTPVQVGSQ